MRATGIVITRADGTLVELAADDRIVSPRGAIGLEDVPRVLSEDGGWIEYEDTVRNTGGEPWQDDGACPARIRLFARGVVDTMTLYEAA